MSILRCGREGERGEKMDEETYDKLYLSDERSGTIEGLIESLKILAAHSPNGLQDHRVIEPAHDMIFSALGPKEIPEDSEDGKKLIALGWNLREDEDHWTMFT